MTFPLVILKEKDPAIYYFSERTFGLVSTGGEFFYSKGTIIDAEGNEYHIKKIKGVKRASFGESLRFFQPMRRVDLEIEFNQKKSLSEFKDLVKFHVRKYKSYWEKKDLINDIERNVSSMDSFNKIINYLK